MAFGDYDFTLAAAGGSQQIAATGSVLRVRTATGPVRVRIDGGPGTVLKAGQGFRMKAGKTFRDVTVIDASGIAGNAGTIFIGDAEYEDQTFNGSVTAQGTPGGVPLVIQGVAGGVDVPVSLDTTGLQVPIVDPLYRGNTDTDAAFAGSVAYAPTNWGKIYLVNTAAAGGKNLYVRSIGVANLATQSQGFNITANRTLSGGTLASNGYALDSGNAGLNPAASAIAQIQTYSTATSGGGAGASYWAMMILAGDMKIWTPRSPIKVTPGSSIQIYCEGSASNFAGSFEWYEA